MDFNHDTSTIDVTGSGQSLNISGNGALQLPAGLDATRPTAVAGKFRWSSTNNKLEVAINGSTWNQLQFWSTELDGVSALASNGLISRTASGTYAARVLSGTSSNITVTNGDGVSGNPTIDLANAGTPVTASFVKVTTDAKGRVTATSSVGSTDITTALGYTPLNSVSPSVTSGDLTLFQDPTSPMSAATKQYVDQRAAGLDPKASVRTASSADVVLSNPGTAVFSGVTLTNGDRILIKSQSTGSENGIYIFNGSSSAMTRSTDANTSTLVTSGMFCFVTEGTYAATGWTLATADPITLNTTSLSFTQFNGSTTYTGGTGISISGGAISIDSASVLSGIHALASNGLIVKTGSNTAVSRTFTGTANQLTVTNGDGVSGNPTISITNDVVLPGTTGMTLVTGTNAQETGTTNGMIRYNSDIVVGGRLRQRFNGAWSNVGTGDGSVTSIGLSTTTDGLVIGSTPVTTSGTITIALSSELQGLKAGITTSSGSSSWGILTQTAANTYTTRSLIAGTGISITNPAGTAGNITITNTGVTSVGLSLPSIFNVTTGTVTTTGTLTASLNTQNSNLVLAGPSSGGSATPTFRSLAYADLPIKLFVENQSSPTAPTATGTNAVAIGSGSTASGNNSLAVGDGAVARALGAFSSANGKFATAGDAQSSEYILRNITSNATPTELFLDGTTGTQRLGLPNNSAYYVIIMLVARRTDATGGSSAHKHEFLITRDGTAATTAIVGAVSKTVMAETNSVWDSTCTADSTNGSIKVTVTGEAAKTIRWVAKVTAVEVTN